MTGSAGLLEGNGFNFKRNLPFLNGAGSLGIEVSSDIAPDVAAALASETTPFPVRDIRLGELKLRASTPKPIEFARGAEKISFTASLEGFSGLGTYRNGTSLLKQLGDVVDDFEIGALEFGLTDQMLLAALRWGYAAHGKITGAMGLGAVGKATLTVSGDKEGLFAVVRRLPVDTPARAVIQEAIDSWILPLQIGSIDQVPPGTWIVTEAIGKVSLALKGEVGYDFNWVREARLGGLTGDIGLRLEMGMAAAVGFSTSGRCALVVSRDGEARVLRLRMYRLKTRQLDLSLDASLSVEAIDKLLPDKIDDFISAVFETHGQQIVRDLKVLDQWTDPATPLSTILADAGIAGAEALIARLAGVSVENLQQSFDAVHERVVGFIDKWHALPHEVSATLYKLIEEHVDLDELRGFVRKLTTISAEDLAKLFQTELSKHDFFQSPVGRLLEAVARRGVLSLLSKPLPELHGEAKKILAILDGSRVEEVLRNFQNHIETELHLDKVLKVANETDFAALDALLKKKLANFLGKDQLVLPELEKIRKTVNLLLSKRQEYYEKAIEALHRKYNFEFAAAFQSTTTDAALFDATFDFTRDAATVAGLFQQAVQGRLDALFTSRHPQISINTGRITHGIRRQVQIDVTLPYFSSTETHINEALATVEPVDGGLLFRLSGSDTVASNQRKTVLSLSMSLTKVRPDVSGVRVHDPALETTYTMLYAKRNMTKRHVQAQVAPAVRTYFSDKIADLDAFLSFIDQHTEEAIPNTPNVLGNGLISLQVSLDPAAARAAGTAWLSLPADHRHSTYQELSRAIQASLKQNIHDCILGESDRYGTLRVAHTVLGYCALFPVAQPAPSAKTPPFWDFADADLKKSMLRHPKTIQRMKTFLGRAQEVLGDDADRNFFRPADAAVILRGIDVSSGLFESLLNAEFQVIRHAFQGGLAIGRLMADADARPTEAVAAFAEFGSKLSEAFHGEVTELLGPGLRAIGSRVFLDAAAALDPIAEPVLQRTNALLTLEFLKPGMAFNAPALLAAGRVERAQLAFADRVVQIATA